MRGPAWLLALLPLGASCAQPPVWGLNYDHDRDGRLLEDYWDKEWDTVVEDFREMKALRANLVRIHLQLGKFMLSAEQADPVALDRLALLLRLAERTGLRLDVTGLACYHKKEVPAWSRRWARPSAGRCRPASGRRSPPSAPAATRSTATT